MAADVIISYDGTFEEGDVDLVVAGGEAGSAR